MTSAQSVKKGENPPEITKRDSMKQWGLFTKTSVAELLMNCNFEKTV